MVTATLLPRSLSENAWRGEKEVAARLCRCRRPVHAQLRVVAPYGVARRARRAVLAGATR